MQIDIRARGFALTEGLRVHAQRRLQFALARYEDRVVRVGLRLSAVDGLGGGFDKRCLLRIRALGLREILIDEVGADAYSAISRAAERAARKLAHACGNSSRVNGARHEGEVNG